MDRLIKLVKPFNCKVICVHVNQGNNGELDEAMLEGMREALCEKYPYAAFDCRLVQSDNLPEAIDRFIQENQIGALALTTHRRNILTRLFNPSIAQKMILHSKTPVFGISCLKGRTSVRSPQNLFQGRIGEVLPDLLFSDH